MYGHVRVAIHPDISELSPLLRSVSTFRQKTKIYLLKLRTLNLTNFALLFYTNMSLKIKNCVFKLLQQNVCIRVFSLILAQ